MFDVISKLPAELSAQIFSFFNVFELAKLEQVSKSWQNVIRKNPTLWKDDGFKARDVFDVCALQHEGKYKAMLERSHGKLHRIFLPVYLSFKTQGEIEDLLKHLIKSDVEDLWIVIRMGSTCPEHHQHNEIDETTITRSQLNEAVKTVIRTVVRCDQLKNLRLVANRGVQVTMQDFGEPSKWPFAANRLRKLALHNINYDCLFPNEELYQCISKIEDIKLSFATGCGYVYEPEDVWRFISTAKASLKRCSVSFLHYDRNSNLVNTKMVEQLLCNSLEELCIGALPDEEKDRNGMLDKLERCIKVKKWIIYKNLGDADIEEMCVRLQRAPLEEVILMQLERDSMLSVKKMVNDRLCSGSFTKIQKATIRTVRGRFDKEIEWFKEHVSIVDVD
ncbi:uncharacterized protein FA14DRAFT_183414 [Meira miltonrushii]|uniref:F-box domain-containing protein n=1 Tax=Meira miltonrushii TaxID=1280837 RepID=A0A316VP69_9BASI|nr:uncharacterized protein FA14DRAFT_183414 [Meira miltonrushii]PWN37315.1 hypothetical protein FA14DRAFT_183414 [Meira miltonrushii]